MASVTVSLLNEKTKEERKIVIPWGCSRKYALARARVESGFLPSDPVKVDHWIRVGKQKRHMGTKSNRVLAAKRREAARILDERRRKWLSY